MSPATDNFIHSLVEMSKAFEELPTVKTELDHAKAETEALAKMVQEREESILRLKQEIETKNETIRKAEAERDNAELRFLESEEKSLAAVRALRHIVDEAEGAVNVVQPPKPEPQPQVEPMTQSITQADTTPYQPQPGQSGADPTTAPTPNSSMSPTPEGVMEHSDASSVASSSTNEAPGVPQPDPTASSWAGGGHSPETVTPTPNADSGADASSTTSPSTNVDDVGYHNEPEAGSYAGWQEWDVWAQRMNARYGQGNWPQRPNVAAQ